MGGATESEDYGRTPLGNYSPVRKLNPPPHLFSAALQGIPLMELSCGVWRLGLPANEFWKWAVRFLREPSGPVPASEPLPPSRPANEVMPEPSRGWGIWILLQRVCGEVGEGGRRQRTTAAHTALEGGGQRLALRLVSRSGGSGESREFVYRPEIQAGGGEEESPVPAARHIWSRPEHLAELEYKPHTPHLSGLRCLCDPHDL